MQVYNPVNNTALWSCCHTMLGGELLHPQLLEMWGFTSHILCSSHLTWWAGKAHTFHQAQNWSTEKKQHLQTTHHAVTVIRPHARHSRRSRVSERSRGVRRGQRASVRLERGQPSPSGGSAREMLTLLILWGSEISVLANLGLLQECTLSVLLWSRLIKSTVSTE